MTGTHLQLLEGFTLDSAGSRIDLPAGMQRLLAFLAVRGSAHRCFVAGTLWPEVPETQALASLRTGMWRLNRLVVGLVRGTGCGSHLPGRCRSTAGTRRSSRPGCCGTRTDGGAWVGDGIDNLRRGELLPGWYDDWVVFERERLNQLRLHAMELTRPLLARATGS